MPESPDTYVPPPSLCRVEIDAHEGRTHVRVLGEVDLSTVSMVERRIDEALTQWPTSSLIVDLRELEFMDSTGLRLLVALGRNAEPQGYKLTIVRPRADVYRPIEIAGLAPTLPFVDDPDEATGS